MDEQKKIDERVNQLFDYAKHSLIFAKTKNASLLALTVAILAGLLGIDQENNSQLLLLYIPMLPLVLAILILCLSFFPCKRKSTQKNSEAKDAPLFNCENITKMGIDALVQNIQNGTTASMPDYFLIQQIKAIFSTSQAASRQYKLFRLALWITGIFVATFLFYLVNLIYSNLINL